MILNKSKWVLYPLARARKYLSQSKVPEPVLISCETAAKKDPELFGVGIEIRQDNGGSEGLMLSSFVTKREIMNIWGAHSEIDKIETALQEVLIGDSDVFEWNFEETDVKLFDVISKAIPKNETLPEQAHYIKTYSLIWSLRFNNPVGDLSGMFVHKDVVHAAGGEYETGDPVKVMLVGEQEIHGLVVSLRQKNGKAWLNIVATQSTVINHKKKTMTFDMYDKFSAPFSAVEKVMIPYSSAV